MRFFKREKTAKRERAYKVIVRWYNDTPWYLNCTARDIKRFEANSEVRAVEIIG